MGWVSLLEDDQDRNEGPLLNPEAKEPTGPTRREEPVKPTWEEENNGRKEEFLDGLTEQCDDFAEEFKEFDIEVKDLEADAKILGKRFRLERRAKVKPEAACFAADYKRLHNRWRGAFIRLRFLLEKLDVPEASQQAIRNEARLRSICGRANNLNQRLRCLRREEERFRRMMERSSE